MTLFERPPKAAEVKTKQNNIVCNKLLDFPMKHAKRITRASN